MRDRDLNLDTIRQRRDCTVVERTDSTRAKQIAVIWVQDDGEAPEVQGALFLNGFTL